MKFDINSIYVLAKSMSFTDFKQALKSEVSGKPETQVIDGDLIVDITIEKSKPKLFPENFENFTKVASLFNKKFYNEQPWLDCYDKLIRIDGYSEEAILYIVAYFRNENNWWRNSGNFETLIKLRRLNNEKVKYIDVFSEKIRAERKHNSKGFPVGNILNKPDGKQRSY